MGVIWKSVVGLGSVYFAMFAPQAPSHDMAATARLCGEAARAQLEQNQALRADIALAGCTLALTTALPRPETQAVAPPAAPPVAPPPPAPTHRRAGGGTLTQADLQDPWFGPTEHSRKARRPG
jgi:hypothetical protein